MNRRTKQEVVSRTNISPIESTLNGMEGYDACTWVASRAEIGGVDTWLGVSINETDNANGTIFAPVSWSDSVGRDFHARRLAYLAQETGKNVIGIDMLHMGNTSETFEESNPFSRPATSLDRSGVLKSGLEKSLKDGSFKDIGTASWQAVSNTLLSMYQSAQLKAGADGSTFSDLEQKLLDVGTLEEVENEPNLLLAALGKIDFLGYSQGSSVVAGMNGTKPDGVEVSKIAFLDVVGWKKRALGLGRVALGFKLLLSTLGGKKAMKETKEAGLSDGLIPDETVAGLVPKGAVTQRSTHVKYLPRAMAMGRFMDDINPRSLAGTDILILKAAKSIISSRRDNRDGLKKLQDAGADASLKIIKGYDHMVYDALPVIIPELSRFFKEQR
jgi:hypothetical protein